MTTHSRFYLWFLFAVTAVCSVCKLWSIVSEGIAFWEFISQAENRAPAELSSSVGTGSSGTGQAENLTLVDVAQNVGLYRDLNLRWGYPSCVKKTRTQLQMRSLLRRAQSFLNLFTSWPNTI